MPWALQDKSPTQAPNWQVSGWYPELASVVFEARGLSQVRDEIGEDKGQRRPDPAFELPRRQQRGGEGLGEEDGAGAGRPGRRLSMAAGKSELDEVDAGDRHDKGRGLVRHAHGGHERDIPAEIDARREQYRQRRDLLVKGLNEMDLPCEMPQGAFYAFPRVTKISKDSRAAARMLLSKAHVATVPGVVFGGQGEGHVRFSYAIDPQAIEDGLAALKKYLVP